MGHKYQQTPQQRKLNFFWKTAAAASIFLVGYWIGQIQQNEIKLNDECTLSDLTLPLLSISQLCEDIDVTDVVVPENLLLFKSREPVWKKNVLPHMQQIGKRQGFINALELGIMTGSSTRWILENMIVPFPGSQYVGVDDLLLDWRAYFCKNNGHTPLAHQPMMMKANTQPGLIEIAGHVYQFRDRGSSRYGNPKLFDFIYVDAGHSGTEVYSDIALSWALLKKGGLMVLDDYDILDYWTPESPKLIMDPFLHAFQPFIEKHWIVANQVFLIKAEDAIFGNAMWKNVTG